LNHLGSVMVIMLALSVVDYGWVQSAVEFDTSVKRV
jgi:hypothetical protein